MKTKVAKPKLIDPDGKRWEQLANIKARQYAPEIMICYDCGYPVANGYCCGNCGSSWPTDPAKREAYWKRINAQRKEKAKK